MASPDAPCPALTTEQLQAFMSDGYVILPQAVGPDLVDRALRRINAAIGTGKLVSEAQGSFGLAADEKGAPELVDLYHASALPVAVQSLIGHGCVAPVHLAQVSLRFPTMADADVHALGGRCWHIDGFAKNGQHSPFTLLVGVCLSDAPAAGYGNLAVHPGAHVTLQQAVREQVAARAAHFSLIGDDSAPAANAAAERKPDLGPPRLLEMRAGDAVLAHQKLPHFGTPNLSPHIRYQVYFRLRHVDHAAIKEQWLDDLFLPFEGCTRDSINTHIGRGSDVAQAHAGARAS